MTGAQITNKDLMTIVQQVFGSMMGLEVEEHPDSKVDLSVGEVSMATICISGGWNGMVILQCRRKLASMVAQGMFQMDEADISADETKDALGEVINMVGGNLKALLPGPSSLSLPNVVLGTDCSWDVPGGTTLLVSSLQCADEPMSLCVIEERKR